MGAPGFDDAPFAKLPSTKVTKKVTFVYPYYENPLFFGQQLILWDAYPDEVRSMVRVIVVDDGSPTNPAVAVLQKYKPNVAIELYRIDVDVRWNWLAARNIGMHYARDGWCSLTDMDHVITADLAYNLINRLYDPGTIYRFSRREHTGAPIHPHPNSMFMTRAMFWKVGGYDESLSGHYGTDGDWRRRCAETAPVRTLRDELVRYEYYGDSSTTGYKRKQPEDAGKKAIIAKRLQGWRPKVLSFPHHKVDL